MSGEPAENTTYPAGFTPTEYSGSELYQVDDPVFSGPLDLLLFLIHREKIDITDIPVAKITSHYLAYLEKMQAEDIEIASDFLLMAAELIELKARMLLPKPEEEAVEEEEDPRASLARRLLEYERVKKIAAGLNECPLLGREIFTPGALANSEEESPYYRHLDPYSLVVTLAEIMAAGQGEAVRIMDLTQINVRQVMEHFLELLNNKETRPFSDILPENYQPVEKAVDFLAILELAKLHLVRLYQPEPRQEIFIVPCYRDMKEALELLYSSLETTDGQEI